ncbi:MAG: hypothetical protein PH343_01010 [Nitrospira sp.]|nr:hypothetical protein [Nitrospira sp.]
MYSQIGQDDWVLSQFPEGYSGYFLDIGAQGPKEINNTLLLEENGWDGISFDIVDYSEQWKVRKTPFVCADVFEVDFFDYNIPQIVDYLSLDISPYAGARYKALKRLLDFGYEFRVVTLEHNANRGEEHDLKERIPQRILMQEKGYVLVRTDVSEFEDWYINELLLTRRAG